MNDIEKYIHKSQMQEIVDDVILDEETEGCFLIYMQKNGDLRTTGTVTVIEAIGMVVLAMDVLKNIAWDEE